MQQSHGSSSSHGSTSAFAAMAPAAAAPNAHPSGKRLEADLHKEADEPSLKDGFGWMMDRVMPDFVKNM